MPYVLLYLAVEIVALVAVGSMIGLGWTLVVLLAGSVLGLLLARREGVRAAQALAGAVTSRRLAHEEMTDGLLVAAGGVLLFLPGLVTDLAGLLLVFRPTRSLVRRRLVRAAEERAPGLRTARIRSEGPIVEGEVVESEVVDVVDVPVRHDRPAGRGYPVIEGSVVEGPPGPGTADRLAG